MLDINKLKNHMCPSAFCTGDLKEATLENGQKVMQCDFCTYHIDIEDFNIITKESFVVEDCNDDFDDRLSDLNNMKI